MKSFRVEQKLITEIKTELKTLFPDIFKLRLNLDLVKEIACLIETKVKTKKIKIDKLNLFFRIYENIFEGIDPRDRDYIKNVIEYLHANGEIVCYSLLYRLYKRIRKHFLKR